MIALPRKSATMATFDVRYNLGGIFPNIGLDSNSPVPLEFMGQNIANMIDPGSRAVDTILMWQGCQVPQPPGLATAPISNCSAVCADPSSMFSTSQTIMNCLTVSVASVLVESGDLTLNNDSVARADGRLLFGYKENGTVGFNAISALGAFADCASGVCEEKDGGTCDDALQDRIGTLSTGLRGKDRLGAVNTMVDVLTSYCEGADRSLDADISGPGVMISYIIQAIFALVLFVLVQFFYFWVKPLAFLFLSRPWRSKSGPGNTDSATRREAASDLQNRLANSRPTVALLSTAVDFHEVQLFFIIGIQGAAALASMNDSDDISSYLGAIFNHTILRNIAISGFIPCLLIEILLRRLVYYRAGSARPTVHSWWTLILVTIAWILGFVGFISQESSDTRKTASQMNESHPSLSCGSNAGLMVYCGLESAPFESITERLVYSYGVGYPALPALWIEQIAWAIACRKKSDEYLRRVGWYGTGISGLLQRKATEKNSAAFRIGRRVWIVILESIWTLIQAATFVFLLLYIAALFSLIQSTGVSADQWNFGQFVAVTVWAPTITRWIYLTLCESRLPCRVGPRSLPKVNANDTFSWSGKGVRGTASKGLQGCPSGISRRQTVPSSQVLHRLDGHGLWQKTPRLCF